MFELGLEIKTQTGFSQLEKTGDRKIPRQN